MRSWKDDNSRNFGEGAVNHRGDAFAFESWPGASVLLEPLLGNMFGITYESRGQRSVARIEPVGPL